VGRADRRRGGRAHRGLAVLRHEPVALPAAAHGRGRPDAEQIGRIFREESGRSVATLIRVFGDIDLAEDAVQEAFTIALDRWARDGLPPNPGGWITTTARNRAIDRLRRDRRGRELLDEVARSSPDDIEPAAEQQQDREAEAEGGGRVVDDRLRLIFMCCHPALSLEAQVALTLRLLGGLSTEQVAKSFLVTEPTMAQRLVRAKRKIAGAHIPFRVPGHHELPDRLDAVLGVVYLIYNAGADQPEVPGEPSLRGEAIRLARLLAGSMPDEPEVAGLLALLLLTDARQAARYDDDGSLVLLRDQDRSRWAHRKTAEGRRVVEACVRRDQAGPYQLHAAINAVHAEAATFADTDWPRIAALYDHLFALDPSPVVALNRAIAVAEVDGPEAGLALLDELDGLDRYHAFHVARGELLVRTGDVQQGREALLRAATLAPTEPTRRHLRERTEQLAPQVG
jgi:RNA polymerase sigma-70 factor (ECF subfamily)